MKKDKMVLIGPISPYKGGIAHYTDILKSKLELQYDLLTMSYSRQYPKILYPGSEQREEDSKLINSEKVKYNIDTINPINWIKVAREINKYKPKKIIFTWWHPYFTPVYTILLLLINKKDTEIIFICHNVLPHDKFPLSEFMVKMVLKKADQIIVHSNTDFDKAKRLLKDSNVIKSFLATFEDYNTEYIDRKTACTKINIDSNKKNVLFFGFVREYKGLIYALEAISLLKDEIENINLIIAGDFFDKKDFYLNKIKELDIEQNVSIFSEYISDEDVKYYFYASDIVILPYISATQSGIAQMAYGFNKPVIVTDVGGLPEVVDENKTGYIVKSKDSEALAEAVKKYYENKDKIDFEANAKEKINEFSWDTYIENI